MTLTLKIEIVTISKNCILFGTDLSDLLIVKNSTQELSFSQYAFLSDYLTDLKLHRTK